jgi:PIN domain nuclease of toxin-antitoxin system
MILLDTHVLLMLALDPERLSRSASRAIGKAQAKGGVAIASISLWEVAMLVDRGEVRVSGSTESFLWALCHRRGLQVLELDATVAALSTQFPTDFPKDPADRIIAATARAHVLALVTRDGRLQDSALLRTIW